MGKTATLFQKTQLFETKRKPMSIGWNSSSLSLQNCQKHKLLEFEYEIEILRVTQLKNKVIDHCKTRLMTQYEGYCYFTRKQFRLLKLNMSKKQDILFYFDASQKAECRYGIVSVSLATHNGQMSIMCNLLRLPPMIKAIKLSFEVTTNTKSNIRYFREFMFTYESTECSINLNKKQSQNM